MDFPSRLTDQLDALSVALESSGDDLQAILTVLTDDLTAAIPSYVGLSLTVFVGGDPITVDAMNSHPAAASIFLPLASPPGRSDGNHIIFYARQPGAFAELAATSSAAGLDGHVVLDRHLPPRGHGAQVLAQRSDIDQAIGVLIDIGHLPDQARQELHTRAAAAGVTAHHMALDILHHLDDTTEI